MRSDNWFKQIPNSIFVRRQLRQQADHSAQMKLNNSQKIEVVRKDGERKVTQMQQDLFKEQKKSKQKEEEIDELKKYVNGQFIRWHHIYSGP